jgi:hypothetical protein
VQLKDPKQHMVASKYSMLLILTVLEIKLARFLLHLIVQLSFHFCQPILHPILQKEKEMLQQQKSALLHIAPTPFKTCCCCCCTAIDDDDTQRSL